MSTPINALICYRVIELLRCVAAQEASIHKLQKYYWNISTDNTLHQFIVGKDLFCLFAGKGGCAFCICVCYTVMSY